MKKCPHCEKRTIRVFNKTILVNNTITCSNCNNTIGTSRKWHTVISLLYAVILIALIVINSFVDIDRMTYLIILFSSAFVMGIIHLFLVPYEVRQSDE